MSLKILEGKVVKKVFNDQDRRIIISTRKFEVMIEATVDSYGLPKLNVVVIEKDVPLL